jgi:hypothetical protein
MRDLFDYFIVRSILFFFPFAFAIEEIRCYPTKRKKKARTNM